MMRATGGWPAELWIVRHAESVGNAARSAALAAGERTIALPARDPDIALSPRGVEQARALGRWFAGELAPAPPTAILLSPYRRTRQTAAEVAGAAGWPLFDAIESGAATADEAGAGAAPPADAIPLIVDERLREKDPGRLEGLTRAGIIERYPAEATAYDQLGKFYYRPPGGESWCDVILRLRSIVDTLRADHAGGRVLIVAHQVIVVCLRYVLEGLDEARVLELERPGEVANASVTSFRREGERLVLTAFNTVAPLRAEGAPVTAEPTASATVSAAVPAVAPTLATGAADAASAGEPAGDPPGVAIPARAPGAAAAAPEGRPDGAAREGGGSPPTAAPPGGDPPRFISPRLLARWPLPQPDAGGDKDARGRALIVGGDARNPGGALLAATAAFRAGAGKVGLAVAEGIAPAAAVAMPEALVTPLPTSPVGAPTEGAIAALEEGCRAATVVAIGPGLIDPESAGALVGPLAGQIDGGTLLVDAAALAGVTTGLGRGLHGRLLLTPNATEMGFLLDRPPEQIAADPAGSAAEAAERFAAIVVLKGRETWIAEPRGRRFLNRAGNVGLAVSGSGDLLVGIIAGLIARGADLAQAAAWGVYLHGRAADGLARAVGPLGYLPRELPALIPALLASLGGRRRRRALVPTRR